MAYSCIDYFYTFMAFFFILTELVLIHLYDMEKSGLMFSQFGFIFMFETTLMRTEV